MGCTILTSNDKEVEHRSIVHDTALDRREKVRAFSRACNPSFFRVSSQTFQSNTPTPLSAPIGAIREQVSLGLARTRAVVPGVRASDAPTSRGAWGRGTGARSTGRRILSVLGLGILVLESRLGHAPLGMAHVAMRACGRLVRLPPGYARRTGCSCAWYRCEVDRASANFHFQSGKFVRSTST